MTNRRLKPDLTGAVAIFPPVFLETGAHGGCCPLRGKQPPPQICEARRHVNISPWILPYESNHRVQSLGQGTGSSEKYVMTAPFGPWWERPKLKSPPASTLPWEKNHRVQSVGQGAGSGEKYVKTAPFGSWWKRPKLKSSDSINSGVVSTSSVDNRTQSWQDVPKKIIKNKVKKVG
jgi:hypothetical protein